MSRVFEAVDFGLRHLPLFQPFDGGVKQRGRARSDTGDRAVRHFLLVLLRDEILALGRDEVRAVDREQRLALPDVLISGVDEDLLDEAGKAHLDVREPGFVEGDVACGAYLIRYGLALYAAVLHADTLKALRRYLDGH